MPHGTSGTPCPHQATTGYWKNKYQDAQREISALRRIIELNRNTETGSQTNKVDELINLMREEAQRRKASDEELARCLAPVKKESPFRVFDLEDPDERAGSLDREKAALEKRAQDAEQAQAALKHQIGTFRAEVKALAAEARQMRIRRLEQLTQKNCVVLFEEGFTPRSVSCSNTQAWLKAIPQDATRGRTLYFLVRPPHSLPIYVPGWANSGYWFHPEGLITGDREFELIIEVKPNEWCYVGRYRSNPLRGFDMHLSEWTDIDDETKTTFVARVQSQVFSQSAVPASGAGQFTVETIRKNYDTGVWRVPSYSLHCLGYSKTLYSALHSAAMRTVAAAH
ncbi:hypothetical protein DAEQUDRAFT_720868 [Daedalea quercina L-15889]|uniref:DUF6697 domain-containing protein n=1 Tax=Daedalea quercina L-15889 TaxID=1314783 RepID=A0A165TVP8_9APHY|nr:hypothetical protein DAEQUDRAFT_720868 [Daedalea quercina L-15889]